LGNLIGLFPPGITAKIFFRMSENGTIYNGKEIGRFTLLLCISKVPILKVSQEIGFTA
jgi:hypothetical protein